MMHTINKLLEERYRLKNFNNGVNGGSRYALDEIKLPSFIKNGGDLSPTLKFGTMTRRESVL
jgi:hypothetical protein